MSDPAAMGEVVASSRPDDDDDHIGYMCEERDSDAIFESTQNSLLKLSTVLKRKRSLSDFGGGDVEDLNDNDMERPAAAADTTNDCFSGPMQPMLDCYHPKIYGNQKRDFQKSLLQKFKWLGYDQESATGYCYPCQKFSKCPFKFSNWNNSQHLNRHASNDSHITAMMKWHDNLEAVEKNKSVLTQLDSHHAAKVKENRDYVKILIDTIAFLGKQNIPFRGHEEDRSNLTQLSEVNRGNFLEILCLQSSHSSFLRERLETITKNKRHGQWTSYKIQNEIISLLADFTRKKIVEEINNDKTGDIVIAVIADETSDITRHEQISLVISYIDKDGIKRESFLGFIQTEKTDGAHLFKLITEEMLRLGLHLDTVVGLGFDGAGNMSGVNKVEI